MKKITQKGIATFKKALVTVKENMKFSLIKRIVLFIITGVSTVEVADKLVHHHVHIMPLVIYGLMMLTISCHIIRPKWFTDNQGRGCKWLRIMNIAIVTLIVSYETFMNGFDINNFMWPLVEIIIEILHYIFLH